VRNNLDITIHMHYTCNHQAIGYDAKRFYGISVVDPGAVPGDSTNLVDGYRSSETVLGCLVITDHQNHIGGVETGSTWHGKDIYGVRVDTPVYRIIYYRCKR